MLKAAKTSVNYRVSTLIHFLPIQKIWEPTCIQQNWEILSVSGRLHKNVEDLTHLWHADINCMPLYMYTGKFV